MGEKDPTYDELELRCRRAESLLEALLAGVPSSGTEASPAPRRRASEGDRSLEALLEDLPVLAYRCRNDPNWPMLFLSDGARELTGFDREELLSLKGGFFATLVHPDDRGRAWETVQTALDRREPFELEYRLRTRSGEERIVWERGKGIYSSEGELLYLEGLVLDISDRKRAEEALRQSERRVREKLDAILLEGGDVGRLDLGDILDVPAVQSLMDAFYALTHIGVGIIDLQGQVLVATGWQDICTRFHRRHPEACRNCVASDTVLSTGVPPGTFKAYRCANGMWDLVTPLVVGGRHLGNLFLGQFLYDDEEPDEAFFRDQARRFGFDEAAYLEALVRVPRWSHRTVEAAMTFYSRFADLISRLSLGTVRLARSLAEQERLAASLRESETEARRLASFRDGLLDAIPAPVFYKDLQGRYLGVNRTFCRFYGKSEEEMKGRTVFDVASPEMAALYHLRDQEILRGGGVQVYESRIRDAQGNLRDVVFHKALFAGEDGAVRGLIGVILDVTEHKRAEEDLARSQSFLRTLVDSIPDLIWLKDPQGIYLSCNPSFERFFGAREAQILGRTDEDFLGPELAAFFRDHDRKAMEAGCPQKNEEWLTFAEGGYEGLFETVKTPMVDREGRLVGVLGISRDISERKRSEEALRESEARFRSYVENAPYGVFIADEQGRYLQVNQEACAMTGYGREELLDLSIPDLLAPEFRLKGLEVFEELLRTGQAYAELGYVTKEGQRRWWSVAGVKLSDTRFLAYARDITDRRRAEAEREKLQGQLLQSQKMESVGRLAGGVAHDYNNMLGVILGHAEMALAQTDPDHPLYGPLQEIQKAALRSADLTRQLLTFARKQAVVPRVLDLNGTVEGMLGILRRLLGEDIRLDWLPGENLWPLRMDPTQVDQVLANLCVNARDAIEGVGRIVLETSNVQLRRDYGPEGVAEPGDYVLLSVSDDGCGMDPQTREHIFEPFFTTKPSGQGTGLGLATVYGVVTQNRGLVQVYSEPGQGTTFRIYLPRHQGEVPAADRSQPREEDRLRRGGETLVLVEDEPAILRMGKAMLERLGYRVLAAASPREALDRVREESGPVHLLLTDVVMPGMNGRDLLREVRALVPEVRVLFMSGYTANVVSRRGVLEEGEPFLQKPFSMVELAAKVREVLDAP